MNVNNAPSGLNLEEALMEDRRLCVLSVGEALVVSSPRCP